MTQLDLDITGASRPSMHLGGNVLTPGDLLKVAGALRQLGFDTFADRIRRIAAHLGGPDDRVVMLPFTGPQLARLIRGVDVDQASIGLNKTGLFELELRGGRHGR